MFVGKSPSFPVNINSADRVGWRFIAAASTKRLPGSGGLPGGRRDSIQNEAAVIWSVRDEPVHVEWLNAGQRGSTIVGKKYRLRPVRETQL